MKPIPYRIAALLALALLAACSTERPSKEDYVAVVRQIITFVQRDALAHQMGQPSAGPLWVDVRGFGGRAHQVIFDTIPTAELRRTLGKGTRIADPKQVLMIDEGESSSGIGGRWVREYGVYVSPNVARATHDQITMIVVGYITDRREFPTDICDRVWRLRYRRAGAEWKLHESKLMRTCLDD